LVNVKKPCKACGCSNWRPQ